MAEGDQSFMRRRRILIVLSIALAASTWVGLTFTEVSVLGNSADIGDPKNVEYLAYAFWLCALLAYVQSFHAVGAWKKVTEAYTSALSERLMRAMRNVKATPENAAAFEASTRQMFANQTGPRGVPVADTLKYSTRPDAAGRDHDRKWKVRMVMQAHQPTFLGGLSPTGNISFFEVEVTRATLARCAIQAISYIVVRAPYFTDYFAPFVIALLPIPHGVSLFWSTIGAP
jgi:hypothetical protein